MTLQKVSSYQFNGPVLTDRPLFTIEDIKWHKACVFNQSDLVDAYRIFWIKKGKAEYMIDFETYLVEDESLIFLTPGQVFTIMSEKIKEGYNISFQQDFYCIDKHDKEISCNGVLFNNIFENPILEITATDSQGIQEIVDKLMFEFQNPGSAHSDLLKTYLALFIIQTVRFRKTRYSKIFNLNEQDDQVLRKFSQLVEIHFKEKHAVTDYAKLLHLSPKSLTKRLQKLGARSPSSLIKKRLILEAKRSMIYSARSVKEVAYELGFSDPAYFTRFFTKHAGEAPKKYRQLHKVHL